MFTPQITSYPPRTSRAGSSLSLMLGLALSLALSSCIVITATRPSSSLPTATPFPSTFPGSNPTAFPTTSPTVFPSSGATTLPIGDSTPGPTAESATPSPIASVPVSSESPGFHLLPSNELAASQPRTVSTNGVTMSLEQSGFRVGQTIRLSYSGPVTGGTWIGIVPSSVAHVNEETNDQNDIDYKYLSGNATGVLEFNVPQTVGSYDFRYNENDSGGRELASISFTSSRGLFPEEQRAVSLSLSPGPYRAGQAVTLSFSTPTTFATNAWIGLFTADKPHGDEQANDQVELAYQYLNGSKRGELSFTLPTAPGRYDFRMHDRDNGGIEACYFVFDVLP